MWACNHPVYLYFLIALLEKKTPNPTVLVKKKGNSSFASVTFKKYQTPKNVKENMLRINHLNKNNFFLK